MEREQRLLLAEERAHEVSVFGFVAIGDGFVHHHGHLSRFGILLLHDVFARLALHGAREE